MEDLRDIVLAAGGLGWYTRTGQLSWGLIVLLRHRQRGVS